MGITRRLTSGDQLFPDLAIPPLGWTGNGFTFSLADYNEEAARRIAEGKKEAEAHRELAREVGPDAWTERMVIRDDGGAHFRFYTGIVYLPKTIAVKPPMVTDREFAFHKDDRIICGWWFDRRSAKGQSTIGAWIASKIGYISAGQPLAMSRNTSSMGETPNYKLEHYYSQTPRCVGINPYRDFQYIGEFPRRIIEYPNYVEPAVKAIRDKFMRLHNLGANK